MAPIVSDVPGYVAYGLFLGLLALISVIDLRTRTIPNRLILMGLAVGLPLIWWSRSLPLSRAVLGLILTGGLMLIAAVLARGGVGGGDVKLAGLIGFYLGPVGGVRALYAGIILGALVSLVLLVLKARKRKDFIPYGPFLAFGALVSLLWDRLF